MEHCGDDFLAALADAMQDTEEWEDLEAIESEACGALSKIIEKKVANNHGIENGPSFGSSDIGKEDSHGHSVDEALKASTSFVVDDDSDLEILSQKDGHPFNSSRKQDRSAPQCVSKQPLISTVSGRSCLGLQPSLILFFCNFLG